MTSQILLFGEQEFDDFDEVIYAKGGLRMLAPILEGEGPSMIEEVEEEDEETEEKKKNN